MFSETDPYHVESQGTDQPDALMFLTVKFYTLTQKGLEF